MALTTTEVIWIRSLLRDLGFSSTQATQMFCDDQAAIYIVSNLVFHERTKHIEMVQANIISTPFVRTDQQLADVFTKSLPAVKFQNILFKLGSIDIFTPT